MNLTKNDKQILQEIGIDEMTISKQFMNLKNGPEPLNLISACTVGNGIRRISNKQKESLINDYENRMEGKSVSRFTPASGAATRMFKHLFDPKNNQKLANEFVDRIKNFAFYDELSALKSFFSFNFCASLQRSSTFGSFY
jgi:hypothetical protein